MMKKLLYFLLVLFAFSSCVKEITLDLSNRNPNYPVFSGLISSNVDPSFIQVKKSQSFSTEPVIELINDMSITVSNNGNDFVFNNSGGVYIAPGSFNMIPGPTSIRAEKNGEDYVYNTTVYNPVTSVSASFDEDFGVNVLGSFDDGVYYLLLQLEMDITGAGSNFVHSGLPDQAVIIDAEAGFYDLDFFWGDYVEDMDDSYLYRVQVLRISADQYGYWNTFQAEQTGALTSATPGNVENLFSNNGLGIVLVGSSESALVTF